MNRVVLFTVIVFSICGCNEQLKSVNHYKEFENWKGKSFSFDSIRNLTNHAHNKILRVNTEYLKNGVEFKEFYGELKYIDSLASGGELLFVAISTDFKNELVNNGKGIIKRFTENEVDIINNHLAKSGFFINYSPDDLEKLIDYIQEGKFSYIWSRILMQINSKQILIAVISIVFFTLAIEFKLNK
jgi:hypothetical protein